MAPRLCIVSISYCLHYPMAMQQNGWLYKVYLYIQIQFIVFSPLTYSDYKCSHRSSIYTVCTKFPFKSFDIFPKYTLISLQSEVSVPEFSAMKICKDDRSQTHSYADTRFVLRPFNSRVNSRNTQST